MFQAFAFKCNYCRYTSGDIPGQPVIWFTLRGTFDAATRAVVLTKTYERPVPEGTEVEYKGKLHALNSVPEITGTWVNASGGTAGTFSCVLRGGAQGAGAGGGDAA